MLELLIFLSTFSILHTSSGEATPQCICDNDNATIASYLYDDAADHNAQLKLELITTSNKALLVGMELLNERLKKQHDILMEINRSLSRNSNSTAKKDNLDLVNASTTTCNTKFPSNCLEAAAFKRKSGLYTIQLHASFNQNQPFLVACIEDNTLDANASDVAGGVYGGSWTVIQRRLDGSVDFYRKWAEYKMGFGNLNSEFWIGLNKLHALTTQTPQELLIILEDFDNVKKYAKYTAFAIGNEQEAYALNVLGSYSGNAGDSLRYQVGMKFAAKDFDNDGKQNCAITYTGAWWYHKCHLSNLNGQYLRGAYSQDKYAQGVVWHSFRGYNYAMKSVQMLIRPIKD